VKTHLRSYFPLGYPVALSSDSEAVHGAASEAWHSWRPLFDVEPFAVDVRVTAGGSSAPRATSFSGIPSGFRFVADETNFAVGDFQRRSAILHLDEDTVRDSAYLRYHFLEAAVTQLISASHHAPIHAACVSPPGEAKPAGVLLCGDSGAGKSSLAYACARRGWTYTSDDASFLLRDAVGPPSVVGDAHRMRMRPESARMFPELSQRRATERGNGDWRFQIPCHELPIGTSPTAAIGRAVLLRRDETSPARLEPWRREAAESWFGSVFYHWAPEIAEEQRRALASLLESATIQVLTYSRYEHAIEALERSFPGTARSGGASG